MILPVLTFLFLSISNANDCGKKPAVGFGFSSLEELKSQINKSYSIKDHCKKHVDVASSLSDQKSDEEALEKSISSSKLILMGEEHHTPSQRNYGDLLKNIKQKKPGLNCVFLEFNPNDEDVKKLINGEPTDSFNHWQYLELVTAARGMGIKVFAVDGRDQSIKPDSQNISSYIRSSNSYIHKNVKTLFDSETCSSGIMPVGKAHIEHPQIQINIKDSLKTFFENSQIPTVAINLVYTGKNVYSENHDQQWKWNICDETPLPLKKQMVIKRDRLNSENGMVIFPVNTYDFYLFIPEVESNRLYQ